MSLPLQGRRFFNDAQAMQAIAQFKEPLKMAVASILWWDNVSHTEMLETYKAMQPDLRHRIYPTTAELVDAMVKVGFTRDRAVQRIVDESVLAKEKGKSMRRMRARRKKGMRQ
jgi:hypothetical protein